MNFREASECAKNNPGSILTRNDDGVFVVKRDDGSLIQEVGNSYIEQQYLFRLRGLEEKLTYAEEQLAYANDKLSRIAEEKEKLIRKLETVSDHDWETIRVRNEAMLKQEYEKKLKERRVVSCQCRGQVESCHYCFGQGTYETNGFGKRL